jgi:hypothetical protein
LSRPVRFQTTQGCFDLEMVNDTLTAVHVGAPVRRPMYETCYATHGPGFIDRSENILLARRLQAFQERMSTAFGRSQLYALLESAVGGGARVCVCMRFVYVCERVCVICVRVWRLVVRNCTYYWSQLYFCGGVRVRVFVCTSVFVLASVVVLTSECFRSFRSALTNEHSLSIPLQPYPQHKQIYRCRHRIRKSGKSTSAPTSLSFVHSEALTNTHFRCLSATLSFRTIRTCRCRHRIRKSGQSTYAPAP